MSRPLTGNVKRQKISLTLDPGLIERLRALQAATGLDVSRILERAGLSRIEEYEADPSSILRD